MTLFFVACFTSVSKRSKKLLFSICRLTIVKITKSSKTRFRKKFGLFVLYFICLLITSCSGETSRNTETRVRSNRVTKNITTDNQSVTVSGVNASGESFECSGNDPNIRIDKADDISGKSNEEIYDCRDGELIINR